MDNQDRADLREKLAERLYETVRSRRKPGHVMPWSQSPEVSKVEYRALADCALASALAQSAVAAALPASPGDAGEWQDISTAPKDGTPIIGAFWGIRWADSHRKGDVVRCWWQPEFDAYISSCREMVMAPGYTINGKTRELHSPVVEPVTHWMPLPALQDAPSDDKPDDGCCVRCGAAPRNASGLCATCLDEDAIRAGEIPSDDTPPAKEGV